MRRSILLLSCLLRVFGGVLRSLFNSPGEKQH
jgi:hypothetical protein